MKTSELVGPALNWAVASIEGVPEWFHNEVWITTGGLFNQVHRRPYNPSEKWSQGGPIIEREIFKLFKNIGGTFTAQVKTRVSYYSPTYDADIGRDEVISRSGTTPLIAAMRCYVASKLGDEVEIPKELLGEQ